MQVIMAHTILPGSCRLPARTICAGQHQPAQQQLQLAAGRACCSSARLVATSHVHCMPVCGQRRAARTYLPVNRCCCASQTGQQQKRDAQQAALLPGHGGEHKAVGSLKRTDGRAGRRTGCCARKVWRAAKLVWPGLCRSRRWRDRGWRWSNLAGSAGAELVLLQLTHQFENA